MDAQVILVGSGPSAVQAAQTLIEKNIHVLIIDYGVTPEKSFPILESGLDFDSLRASDPEQYQYFAGENEDMLPWGNLKGGAQFTPPRKYILQSISGVIDNESKDFWPIESLAKGGLGAGWGAGCYMYSKNELRLCGLDETQILTSYKTVCERMGVSTPDKDIENYTVKSDMSTEQPIKIDKLMASIQNRYKRQEKQFLNRGFHLGRPSLALLSSDKGDRLCHKYLNLEFYSDHDRSIYRPQFSIDHLKKNSKFVYKSGFYVYKFQESGEKVFVYAKDKNNVESIFSCKKLILCSGVFGTARIVIRSLGTHKTKLPFLCNSYTYVPSIYLAGLFSERSISKFGLAQLILARDVSENNSSVSIASMYSYHSLLLYRLIQEIPMNIPLSTKLVSLLQSSLVIYGIHHPDRYNPDKTISLQPCSASKFGDQLKFRCHWTQNELVEQSRIESSFIWAMRKLGCFPLKKVNPGYGASIHYGGTLPYEDKSKDLFLDKCGTLSCTKHVYVGDGSGLRFLPAKGVTLTLMAIGDSTAKSVADKLN